MEDATLLVRDGTACPACNAVSEPSGAKGDGIGKNRCGPTATEGEGGNRSGESGFVAES